MADSKKGVKYYIENDSQSVAADPVIAYMKNDEIKKLIDNTRKEMEKVAKDLDFLEAARLRDEMQELQKRYDTM